MRAIEKNRQRIIAALLLAGLCCVLIQPSIRAETAKKIKAIVSILPQEYFVKRVGGDYVEVQVLVPPGQSPETFEPTPRQMAALSVADIYFRIGLPFENQLVGKIAAANPRLKIVDTRDGITLHAEDIQHGHGSASDMDPHIWLDPKLVEIQAANIARGLSEIDSTHRDVFERNLKEFQADLRRVDSLIAEVLAPLKGRTFYVFHPAYGYFGAAYGLKQKAVEVGGKEPGAKQLAELIDQAKKENVRIIFVQPQFSKASAETVAKAIGGAVVPLDPLAGNYLENLEKMAAEIRRALGAGSNK
jgi:zinc transport system substrate-binding protein